MDSYEVFMTPDAVTDLTKLRDYIADILLVPEIALRYVRSIRETINKLEYTAANIAQSLTSHGIREISAKSTRRSLSSITGLTKAENGFMS